MKLQFDPNQTFQLEAVASIGDLFDGQPQGEPTFSVISIEAGEDLLLGYERTELGVGNRLLLSSDTLRKNLRLVQRRNEIDVADEKLPVQGWDIFDAAADRPRRCPHFSVEMETGTGKTYVYLRTIFELAKRYALHEFRHRRA